MESPSNRSTTGRNLSPLLRPDLANLNDDGDSRKSAMKTVKSYVIRLDSKSTPQFLAQVSSTEFQGNKFNFSSKALRIVVTTKSPKSTTGRNLSPLLRPDLANLNDDGDSRKSTIKTMKSYVIRLDSKSTPQFLAQVSSTEFQGNKFNVTTKSPRSTTGRNLSPLLRPDLANLNDDGDSRKSAMKTLKSYVIRLDSKSTPQFLAQVSSTEFQGNKFNVTTKSPRSTTGRNLSPLLRPDLANLNDDGDSRKSAMKTLKSYVIRLDSKANPQFLAQVSSTEFQGNISNLTCSRRKRKKQENETQKTAHENPDLLGRNLVSLNALFLKSTTGRNLSPLLWPDLANLNDDGDSRKSAMKTLKSYVIRLDSKATPQFLAQVSYTEFQVLMESPSNRSTIGRTLSPLLQPDLANLNDDGDSRKSAMKTLKSNVIGMDSKATPQFLAQVSYTEFQGNISNLTFRTFCFLICVKKEVQRGVSRMRRRKSKKQKASGLVFREFSSKALRIVVTTKSPKSTTGRNLSPLLRLDLANLNDDGDSRKSTIKTMKSYVIRLDSKSTPQFLAQVSSTEFQGNKFNVRLKKTKEARKGNSEDSPRTS
ncbi:PROTEIN SINE1 [Salix koriyanagi]|uniref:PROTEIN SINE1 n=1 Tax=Salix koriyanagi TaxID=2511006 RepID=A0A9Q0NXB0_9ROSI|nr:PROTEIN SINE1 [Salix koriyanagi]